MVESKLQRTKTETKNLKESCKVFRLFVVKDVKLKEWFSLKVFMMRDRLFRNFEGFRSWTFVYVCPHASKKFPDFPSSYWIAQSSCSRPMHLKKL